MTPGCSGSRPPSVPYQNSSAKPRYCRCCTTINDPRSRPAGPSYRPGGSVRRCRRRKSAPTKTSRTSRRRSSSNTSPTCNCSDCYNPRAGREREGLRACWTAVMRRLSPRGHDHGLSERPTDDGDSEMNVLKRAWIPLLVVVVVAIAGFTVYRVRAVFGSDNETTSSGAGLANDAKPFNPKGVTYEIFGPEGAVATINYLDLSAQPQEVKDTSLPWSVTLTTTAPASNANIVAQ